MPERITEDPSACAPRRLFLVGTDTDCGKTAVTCALLRSAAAAGLAAIPFKPAASGPAGTGSDPARLLRAAGLPDDALAMIAMIAPLRYEPPLAPGVADDRDRFLLDSPPPPSRRPLELARAALARAERRYRPAVTLIEGAGGLHVPMPGGTWLPEWITALAATPVIVGRLGLGTINHTLLTIDALRQRGLTPAGFLLSRTRPAEDDRSCEDNPTIITRARGLPCLGVLPYTPEDAPAPRDWHHPELWPRLMAPRTA
ncbi:MAG: dethiobiotin synthase [Myxococcales bacterium]|nr:dethiobiotin synthase [Myxococcales bacterium]MCB9750061.1 dethiobiotin synthase [Myxococcales bacterium]